MLNQDADLFQQNGNRPYLVSHEVRDKPTLTPTLVIGLGGTGKDALRYLKRRLVYLWNREQIDKELEAVPPSADISLWHKDVWRRYEMEGGPPIMQLLGVDTWPWSNRTDEVYLNHHEYAYIGNFNATRVLQNKENHPEIADWWQWPEEMINLGQISRGAHMMPIVGRLSLYRKWPELLKRLDAQIDKMTSLQAQQETEDNGYLVSQAGSVRRIYVVFSPCGGTGAGTYQDLVAYLRHRFGESAFIIGICVLPSVFKAEIKSSLQRERIQANAYAALKQITYFQSNSYSLWLPRMPRVEVPYLFNRIYLIGKENILGKSLDSITDVKQLVANQIFLESMTDVGAEIWQYDDNIGGERRRHNGLTQAYIASSFANSSLIVPRDEMQEYCELRYAESLIQDGVLRDLLPDERNQLNTDTMISFGRLKDIVVKTAGGEDDTDFEDEEEEEDALSIIRGAAEPELRETAPLELFQQEFMTVVQKYSLPGAQLFLSRLMQQVDHIVEQARQTVDELGTDLQRAINRLNRRTAQRPWHMRFTFFPISLVTDQMNRQYRRALAALRRNEAELRGRLDFAQHQRDSWVRLQGSIHPLPAQLDDRIQLLKTVRDQQIKLDMQRLFDSRRITEHPAFEMFTTLLGQEYIENTLYPNVVQAGLGNRSQLDVAALLAHPTVLRVDLTLTQNTAAGRSEHQEILEIPPVTEFELARAVEAIARRSTRQYLKPEMFFIRNLLKNQTLQIQTRLHDLFTRCVPFWNYDLDRGGIAKSDLEEMVFAGLENISHRDWKYLLRDHPDFDLVETADPTRIDACRIEHGLPMAYLIDLETYKNHYDRFYADLTSPLQLDARWEPDGAHPLPELIGDPPHRHVDNEATVPAPTPSTNNTQPPVPPLPMNVVDHGPAQGSSKDEDVLW